jgi:predicted amidohydrolase YtcJ
MASSAILAGPCWPESRVRIIDLRGRTVVPGLVEPHIHTRRS